MNTLSLDYKDHQSVLLKEIIPVCFENHTKLRYTMCGQNIDFFGVKPGGT